MSASKAICINTLHATFGLFTPGISMPQCGSSRLVNASIQTSAALFKILLWGSVFATLTYTLVRPGYLRSLKLVSLADCMTNKADLLRHVADAAGILGGAVLAISALGGVTYTERACKIKENDSVSCEVQGCLMLVPHADNGYLDNPVYYYIETNYNDNGTPKGPALTHRPPCFFLDNENLPGNIKRHVIQLDTEIEGHQVTGNFIIVPENKFEPKQIFEIITPTHESAGIYLDEDGEDAMALNQEYKKETLNKTTVIIRNVRGLDTNYYRQKAYSYTKNGFTDLYIAVTVGDTTEVRWLLIQKIKDSDNTI